MKRNWFKLMFAAALLAAVACLAAGCNSTPDDSEYVEKELLYSAAYSTDDVMDGGPSFICRVPDKECNAHYRGVGTYRADGTPVSIELTYYYKNVRTNEKLIYKFDNEGRLVWSSVTGDTVYNVVTVHTYDSRGRCISTVKTNKDGLVEYRRENEYDRKGRLIFTNCVYFAGTGEQNGTYTTAYEYDRRGNLIVETDTRTSYYGELYTYVTEYQYDIKDRIIEEKYYADGHNSKTIAYEYDDQGRLIREYNNKSDIRSVEYQYDDDGSLVQKIEYPSFLNSKIIYKYQPGSDKLVSVTSYYESGNLDSVEEYDENGYVRTSISYHRDDGMPRTWFEYDYDAVGNLREEYVIGRDGFSYHYGYDYDYQGNRTSKTTYDEEGNIIDVQHFDIHERLIRLDRYQGNIIAECEKYVYSEPKYTGDFDYPMTSTKLRTEYCTGAGVVLKYTEHDGAVDRTYNSNGTLMLLEEWGNYEMIDGDFQRYNTLTEYRLDGTLASVTVVNDDGEVVSVEKYDNEGKKIG